MPVLRAEQRALPETLDAGANVLIVDREECWTRSLRGFLSARGWSAAVADPDSLPRLAHHAEVALVDVCPDGVVRLDWIRELKGRNPKTRVVAVTSYASMTLAVAAVRAGAECCLLKPIPEAELERALQGHDSASGEPAVRKQLPTLGSIESEYIYRVLTFHCGNISAAARTLGIRRSTLQRRLKKIPPSI
jgi:two-component system, response regulator RegA